VQDLAHGVSLPESGVLGGHQAAVELARDAVERLPAALELAHQADDLLLRAVAHEARILSIPAEGNLAPEGVPLALG